MRTHFALITVVFLLASSVARAQYQTATLSGGTSGASSSIVVPAGKVCEVVSFAKTFTTGTAKLEYFGLLFQGTSTDPKSFFVVGPATLTLTCVSNGLVCTYRIFDNTAAAGQGVPSTAVVIPADSTGPVQIILESSTDLITWTAADPGSYAASTTKRFFRVRAVQQ
jgi:hypothetical protein